MPTKSSKNNWLSINLNIVEYKSKSKYNSNAQNISINLNIVEYK